MSVRVGRNAKVTLGTYTVAKMAEWNFDGITTDTIDITAFGDSFKQYELGLSDYGTLSFRGHYDPDDTNGQLILDSALLHQSKIANIRLYIDNTSYYCPHTSYDSGTGNGVTDAGVYITAMKIGMANAGVGSIDFTGRCTGPLHLTSGSGT